MTYQGQSGALNESISDVFGSLVKQYALGQTAEQADWLIGEVRFGLPAPCSAITDCPERDDVLRGPFPLLARSSLR